MSDVSQKRKQRRFYDKVIKMLIFRIIVSMSSSNSDKYERHILNASWSFGSSFFNLPGP